MGFMFREQKATPGGACQTHEDLTPGPASRKTGCMSLDESNRIHGRGERLADGVVHGVAIAAALFGGGFVLAHAVGAGTSQLAVLCIYAAALVAMLSISAAYNLMPESPAKNVLRRLDHSAIYVMIAATYTPLLVQLHQSWLAIVLAVVVWLGASLGVAIKLLRPGRHEGLSVLAYLVLGWVGALAIYAFWQALPHTTLILIIVGGLLYSAGVPFYLWERLKYQRAIWHGFVAAAAACHFVGIAGLYL
jgi:hemolysin III